MSLHVFFILETCLKNLKQETRRKRMKRTTALLWFALNFVRKNIQDEGKCYNTPCKISEVNETGLHS